MFRKALWFLFLRDSDVVSVKNLIKWHKLKWARLIFWNIFESKVLISWVEHGPME